MRTDRSAENFDRFALFVETPGRTGQCTCILPGNTIHRHERDQVIRQVCRDIRGLRCDDRDVRDPRGILFVPEFDLPGTCRYCVDHRGCGAFELAIEVNSRTGRIGLDRERPLREYVLGTAGDKHAGDDEDNDPVSFHATEQVTGVRK